MKNLLIILLLIGSGRSFAQSVAVNTDGSTANASSILDVKSTAKGILIPRMSKAEKNAIATPAAGLLVYQLAPDSIGFHFYNGSTWVWLQNTNSNIDWSTLGNNNTDTSVNFIGTTNSMPLRFKINNQWAGQIDTRLGNIGFGLGANAKLQTPVGSSDSRYNLALGNNALATNTSGHNNIAVGYQALLNNTDINNLAFGNNALRKNSTGNENIAIGNYALDSNNAGNNNVAVGYLALRKNVNSSGNVAVGSYALMTNESGSTNTAIGNYAGLSVVSGASNTFVGASAGYSARFSNENVAVGKFAFLNDSSGAGNIAIGYRALVAQRNRVSNIAIGRNSLENNGADLFYRAYQPHEGFNNIAIGENAMSLNKTGSNNIVIGYEALALDTNSYDNIAIGYLAGGRGSIGLAQTDNIFIGNFAGSASRSGNKLYIDNRYADSTTAFIYGDFAADSLRFNAAITVRDYSRFGSRTDGAPAIKMKKIAFTNGAAGVVSPVAHGLTQAKILSVSVYINGISGNDIAPNSTYSNFVYDMYISSSSIVIRNISGNDSAITGRPGRILITYEE